MSLCTRAIIFSWPRPRSAWLCGGRATLDGGQVGVLPECLAYDPAAKEWNVAATLATGRFREGDYLSLVENI